MNQLLAWDWLPVSWLSFWGHHLRSSVAAMRRSHILPVNTWLLSIHVDANWQKHSCRLFQNRLKRPPVPKTAQIQFQIEQHGMDLKNNDTSSAVGSIFRSWRSSWAPVPGFSTRILSCSLDYYFVCQSFCYCEACSIYVYKRASLQTAVYVNDCMHGCSKTNMRFTLVRCPNHYETRESFAWTALKNREENVPPSAQRSKALRWL